MIKRKFQCPVPTMLVSAVTAANNMETNIEAFAKDYPDWTVERLNIFYTEIEDVSGIIGIKSGKAQHEATLNLKKIAAEAVDGATIVKSQMERGYRKEPARLEELMQLTGFDKNWAKARNGNQNSLLNLMHTFNNNTDDNLCQELVDHGVAEHRIVSMKNASHKLLTANIAQETLKSETPVITSEITIRLNEIYDTAIDICTAGKNVFRRDPVRRSQFSFAKLSAQQTAPGKPKQEEPPAKPENDSMPTEII